MTNEDIHVEFEAFLAYGGEKLKECPTCGIETFRKRCPVCGIGLSGDREIDALVSRAENGEDLTIESLLGHNDFTPVKPGEVP